VGRNAARVGSRRSLVGFVGGIEHQIGIVPLHPDPVFWGSLCSCQFAGPKTRDLAIKLQRGLHIRKLEAEGSFLEFPAAMLNLRTNEFGVIDFSLLDTRLTRAILKIPLPTVSSFCRCWLGQSASPRSTNSIAAKNHCGWLGKRSRSAWDCGGNDFWRRYCWWSEGDALWPNQHLQKRKRRKWDFQNRAGQSIIEAG